MINNIRPARVTAFCNWLETIPPSPPFHEHPEFGAYTDLSDVEIRQAEIVMRQRAAAADAEAATFAAKRGGTSRFSSHTPEGWLEGAIASLRASIADVERGAVTVSVDAVQVVLIAAEERFAQLRRPGGSA